MSERHEKIKAFCFADDGKLWTCGSNSKGQLGLGSLEDVLTLTLVNDLKDISMVAGGWDFSLAVSSRYKSNFAS